MTFSGLVLFDIDLTLLRSGGAGLRSLRAAFRELFGVADAVDGYRPHGAMDRDIFRDLLAAHAGSAPADALSRVEERYLAHLEREIAGPPPPHLMPGVPAVLEALEALDGCRLGLLTGNLRRGAELKLSAFGLWGRFPVGAFADDHPERWGLVEVARSRAQARWGSRPADHEVFVVGDSPKDVRAARRAGAIAVAVAAGDHRRPDLQAEGPDVLLDDLTDPPALVRALAAAQERCAR